MKLHKNREQVISIGILFFASAMSVHAATQIAVGVSPQTSLYINEFMASNKKTIVDKDGDYSDWIEIYNPSDNEVSLSGWSLTTKASNSAEWQFPQTAIAAHGYLLVFASGKDLLDASSELHTNFKLSAGGEHLALIDPNGVAVISLDFPEQSKDISYGIYQWIDDKPQWVYFNVPTPGLVNDKTSAPRLDKPEFSQAHGICETPFQLTMTSPSQSSVYYTTDGSVPDAQRGTRYLSPLDIEHTATIRAIAIPDAGSGLTQSGITTSTYLFIEDVLKQSNSPEGYPSVWGPYSSIQGMAIADYEMDPELLADADMQQHVANGLKSLPIISLVTDKDNFFSDTKNEDTGGIYIYTGGDASSSGNGYGDGWLRPVSAEYFSLHDDGFQIDCAVKIHGNASRQAEKTPKHSLRLQFKSSYGPSKLEYPLFGKKWTDTFDQLVIRAGFGNSWCHWLTGQQKQAMFTRDAWAKRMMSRRGYVSSGTRFAHLFINGLYWGMYNPTERIDGDFCEYHLGGKGDNYDVVRFDDGALNTVDGQLDDYKKVLTYVNNASDYAVYQKMQGNDTNGNPTEKYTTLFDVDNFIDYMLVNQYAANGDWDHHNWVAVRDRTGNKGFQWLPWDSELVLQGVNDNVLTLNNDSCPTSIFTKLMQKSPRFRMQYIDRAYQALAEPFGMLSADSAYVVWHELTEEIDEAVYAEAARWGDYRRDVHPYTTAGSLYTKDNQYEKQKTFMTEKYFPQRTDIFLNQLKAAGYWATLQAPCLNVNDKKVNLLTDTIMATDEIGFTYNGSSNISNKTIYYTTDGSDPLSWAINGYPVKRTGAQTFNGKFSLPSDGVVLARTYLSGSGWSPLTERHFVVLADTASAITKIDGKATNVRLSVEETSVSVILHSAGIGNVSLTLYDMSGRILHLQKEDLAAGLQTVVVPVDLASGVYMIQVTINQGQTEEKQMLKFVKI